jgi:integrase
MKRRGKKVTDEVKVRRIFELREKGYSKKSIAKTLQVKEETVRKYLGMGGLDNALKYLQEATSGRTEVERIWGDEKANEFLESLAEGTRGGYAVGLSYYCEMIGKLPCELIDEAKREIKAGLLLDERSYFRYLNQFERELRDEGYAPHSIVSYITAVRSFYGFYFIDIPKRRKRRVHKVRPLEENQKNGVTKADIQQMMMAAKNFRDKAMILTLVSSGLGRAEVADLGVKDFYEGCDSEVCMFETRRKKTGNDFVTFISPEATKMIWDYFKHERGITKENIKEHLNESLFAVAKKTQKGGEALKAPLAVESIDRIFRDIGRRIGYAPTVTEKGNMIYGKCHPHNLRKFFNTKMKNAGMPEYIVEYLMGHEIDGTRAAYYQRRIDELRENYLRFMPAVIIQPTETQVLASGEYKELSDKITLYEAALKERNGEIAKLREEMETMKRDGHYHQLAYDFVKLLSRDPTAATRFSEFIDREKLREMD